VFLPRGHGDRPFDLEPGLGEAITRIYDDAKVSIWAELPPGFVAGVPGAVPVATRSENREDYILHPESGERLSDAGLATIRRLRREHNGRFDVQIVISDGLNALAITEEGHLTPFLDRLRAQLERDGFRAAPEHIVVTSGRVRAGYRIGETLFGGLDGPRAVLHLIGERPGTGHRTFSVYLTSADGAVWGREDAVDHNITKVVSGIATTALAPAQGVDETMSLLKGLRGIL
jgi:ethanolamine ammonia-lyase large subunit